MLGSSSSKPGPHVAVQPVEVKQEGGRGDSSAAKGGRGELGGAYPCRETPGESGASLTLEYSVMLIVRLTSFPVS